MPRRSESSAGSRNTRAGGTASQGWPRDGIARGAARGAAPSGVRNQLPDARQRGGGGGCGSRGSAPPPLRAGGRRADRVPSCVPCDGRHAALDRPAALRAGAAGDLRGQWLPEPLVTDSDVDPARQAELADSLSLAFLVLLESLSPEQRAALLLHD